MVDRLKCRVLSSHVSTSGTFVVFDILAKVCAVPLAVCTLRRFNSAFYVHILFTFFPWSLLAKNKYIYFKGVWELSLQFPLQ